MVGVSPSTCTSTKRLAQHRGSVDRLCLADGWRDTPTHAHGQLTIDKCACVQSAVRLVHPDSALRGGSSGSGSGGSGGGQEKVAPAGSKVEEDEEEETTEAEEARVRKALLAHKIMARLQEAYSVFSSQTPGLR